VSLVVAEAAVPVQKPVSNLWTAPDVNTISDEERKEKIIYGRELIAHTARYLGPHGVVMQISNGMNCQNCHLDAGTKPWGNNYGSVASLYPRFRARSGTVENIYKRVNDCIQRSLNGKPLDSAGKEMQAIKSYIEFLGSNVEKGQKAEGSGFKELAFLDRAADPQKGHLVYTSKCQRCHQPDGSGIVMPDGSEYVYPPLWGPHSYNNGAGLYRLSSFAKYVKYNMPFGVNHESTQLTDEEAWDVAAFVNSQPRPMKEFTADWPDISKKPIDHPFGPFADNYSEVQHKYGPFKPIEAERKEAEALKTASAGK
jgi:thiosulfate dehydrogenase